MNSLYSELGATTGYVSGLEKRANIAKILLGALGGGTLGGGIGYGMGHSKGLRTGSTTGADDVKRRLIEFLQLAPSTGLPAFDTGKIPANVPKAT